MKKTFLGTGIALTLLSACAPKQSQETLTKSGLNPTNYETIVDGVKPVKLYTLKNAAGMEVCVTNFWRTYCIYHGPRQKWKSKRCSAGF